MNKKSNVNIKGAVNSETSRALEDTKKQSTNTIIENKDTKIIEDSKNDQNSHKTKKESTKNKIAIGETDDKIKEDKPQNNYMKENLEKAGKNPNNIKKSIISKEEMKSPDDLKTKTVSKKSNIDSSGKTSQQYESIGADPDSNKAKSFSNEFEEYIENSGLSLAFKLIFSEIATKHIKQENIFQYTAIRLRQIGKELEDFKLTKA